MSTRPPPPTGQPPPYAIVGRAFGRTNLRPIVMILAITAIVWSLVWAGGVFSDIGENKQNDDLKKLVNFDIVLGTLYAFVAASELFGLFATITSRSPLVRIYVGLSWFVVLVVAAAELVRTVVHFIFKNAMIDECTREATGAHVRTSFGFWGGVTTTLTGNDARDFCRDYWGRNSVSTISWLIMATLVSLIYASIVHSFYRQLLDPTFARAPSDQVRLATLRASQDGNYAPYPGAYYPSPYAPPAGVPPAFNANVPPYEAARLPGYGSEFAPKDFEEKEKRNESGPFSSGPSEVEIRHP